MANAKARVERWFVILLLTWLGISTGLVFAFTQNDLVTHAVISMGAGLVILWVYAAGALMLVLRDRARILFQRIPAGWPVKFVLFCILLAMVEEAITTGMTNLAPVFGVETGQAYITASANYFDVILHHSVVVFVPFFAVWAWMLSRWRFRPFHVFLLFGITGMLAETIAFGVQHLSEFGLWIPVYGLMVYLPAYCLPERPAARKVKIWHLLMAVLLPFVGAIPWTLLVRLLDPGHPDIHFPPIGG